MHKEVYSVIISPKLNNLFVLHQQQRYRAMQRACYTVRFMLADNRKMRNQLYSIRGRVVILGKDHNSADVSTRM